MTWKDLLSHNNNSIYSVVYTRTLLCLVNIVSGRKRNNMFTCCMSFIIQRHHKLDPSLCKKTPNIYSHICIPPHVVVQMHTGYVIMFLVWLAFLLWLTTEATTMVQLILACFLPVQYNVAFPKGDHLCGFNGHVVWFLQENTKVISL